MNIITLILIALATEAAVEITLHGHPMAPVRWLAKKTSFTRKMFSCGWCLSVWAATVVFAFTSLVSPILMYILVAHRLANIIHAAYERMRKGSPQWFDEPKSDFHDKVKDDIEKRSSPAKRPDWVVDGAEPTPVEKPLLGNAVKV